MVKACPDCVTVDCSTQLKGRFTPIQPLKAANLPVDLVKMVLALICVSWAHSLRAARTNSNDCTGLAREIVSDENMEFGVGVGSGGRGGAVEPVHYYPESMAVVAIDPR